MRWNTRMNGLAAIVAAIATASASAGVTSELYQFTGKGAPYTAEVGFIGSLGSYHINGTIRLNIDVEAQTAFLSDINATLEDAQPDDGDPQTGTLDGTNLNNAFIHPLDMLEGTFTAPGTITFTEPGVGGVAGIIPFGQTVIELSLGDASIVLNGGINLLPVDGPSQQLNNAFAFIVESPIGDLNGDQIVNGQDLLILLNDWGQMRSPADLDNSGSVNGDDLLILLNNWG